MPPRSRTRLAPQDRRSALLHAGAELFSRQRYEDVRIDEVAEVAGCSRALLYHYFPNKRALFLAIIDAAGEEIRRRTAPDPAQPPLEQLRAGMVEYFRYAQQHAAVYRSMYRSAAGDEAIREAISGGRRQQELRIIAGLPGALARHPLALLAVKGWMTYATALCLEWLNDDGGASPEQLADVAVATLVAALTQAAAQGQGAQSS